MLRRIPIFRLIRPVRPTFHPRRIFSTASFPAAKSVRLPIVLCTFAVGAGLYSLSHVSYAESESTNVAKSETVAHLAPNETKTAGKVAPKRVAAEASSRSAESNHSADRKPEIDESNLMFTIAQLRKRFGELRDRGRCRR